MSTTKELLIGAILSKPDSTHQNWYLQESSDEELLQIFEKLCNEEGYEEGWDDGFNSGRSYGYIGRRET